MTGSEICTLRRWSRLGRVLAVASCLCLFLMLLDCGKGECTASGDLPGTGEPTTGKWVVELYMCGTDLESKAGAGTSDLVELTQLQPPDGVTFVIQTGGAREWHNNQAKAGEIDRFIFDKDGLRQLAPLPDADMAGTDTFADFLRFAQDNFEADHRIFIVWNHGGGTVGGACYDERTGKMMRLNQMQDALASVYEQNRDEPPFDIVGFDCCLMATYGVANNFEGYGRYLVASQEVEPGNGWYYKGIVKGFQAGVGNDPLALAKVMCDSYMEGCEAAGTADQAALSVTDLRKLPQLRDAYENMGVEAMAAASQAPKPFFSRYAREAEQTTNFGGNTRDTGFTNMIDMGDFAKRTADLLPDTASKVQQALANAVLYRVNGGLRQQSNGLSCYYPYQVEQQQAFEGVRAASDHYKSLYHYLATGEPPDASAMQLKFDVVSMEDLPLKLDKDGTVSCELTSEQMLELSTIRCDLVRFDMPNNLMYMYGNDANVNVDWEKGVCKDNFNGTWPMLDGHLLYIDVIAQTDNSITYNVPIKLNGRQMNMTVVYDAASNSYRILGAREGLNEEGAADRNLVKLKPGDTVTTQQYMMHDGKAGYEGRMADIDTFQLSENFQIRDTKLKDGTYAYVFDFITPTDDTAMSAMAFYEIKQGEVTTYVAKQ